MEGWIPQDGSIPDPPSEDPSFPLETGACAPVSLSSREVREMIDVLDVIRLLSPEDFPEVVAAILTDIAELDEPPSSLREILRPPR